MPFQSQKQRRYMHANLPEIANRWERDYAGGGLIPAHEAGIYGLADGGQLVQPGPGRPGYGGPHETEAAGKESTASSGGGDYEGEAYGTPDTIASLTKTTTPDDSGDDDKAASYVNWNIQEKYTGDEDLETIAEIDKRNALTRLKYDTNLTKDERHNLEVGVGFRPAKTKNKFMSFLGNAALGIIPGLLPAKLATPYKIGKLGWDITKTDRYDRYFELAGINKNDFISKLGTKFTTEDKLRAETKKLQQALPINHPESIALEAQTKTKTLPKQDEDHGPNIKIENIEEVNDAKTQLQQKYQEMNDASRLAWLRQQQMNRDKQMAYYRMMMKPYFTGAAQGGRIPGYNTGGLLSNLFRLKNV